MSTSGGTRAIVAALTANAGIAITKFIAFLLSGSSAMLAEAVHSVADTGNQLLLLIGGRRSKKHADAEHPFGYGRVRFIYAFVVAIILFSVGGMFSIYEGISKLNNPEPLELPWVPMIVLVVAMALETYSLRTAVRESNRVRGKQGWVAFIRHAKAPELPVVLLEDFAALIGLSFAFLGVGLTILTDDSTWDAIGTLGIGALLIVVAIVLGIETKSLLIGEGASPGDVTKIRDAISAHQKVEAIVHMKTLYLGPEELLVASKIAFKSGTRLAEITATIGEVESSIRAAVPIARAIYLEPAEFRSANEVSPPTDAIVIKGAD